MSWGWTRNNTVMNKISLEDQNKFTLFTLLTETKTFWQITGNQFKTQEHHAGKLWSSFSFIHSFIYLFNVGEKNYMQKVAVILPNQYRPILPNQNRAYVRNIYKEINWTSLVFCRILTVIQWTSKNVDVEISRLQ